MDAPGKYDQNTWQFEMDSTKLDVGNGARKYQGAPLGKVLESFGLHPDATTLRVAGVDANGAMVTEQIPIADVLTGDDIRLFSIIGDDEVTFAIANMDGLVLARGVTHIDVE